MLADVVTRDAGGRWAWGGHRGGLPVGRLPFNLWLPSNCPLHKVLDLLGSVDLEHHVEHLLGG